MFKMPSKWTVPVSLMWQWEHLVINVACIPFLLGRAALGATWLLSLQAISEPSWLHFHILTPHTPLHLSPSHHCSQLDKMQDPSKRPWKSISVQLSLWLSQTLHTMCLLLKVLQRLLTAVRIKAKHAAMATRFLKMCPSLPTTPSYLLSEYSLQASRDIGLL